MLQNDFWLQKVVSGVSAQIVKLRCLYFSYYFEATFPRKKYQFPRDFEF